MDGIVIAWLVLLVLALLASAFFSGTEAAFLSVQRGKLAHLVQSGVKGAEKASRLAGNPEKLLPTVLTGNNLVNTAAAALGTALAVTYMSPGIAVIVSTAGVTVLLLIFSETIPKTVAAKNAERFAINAVRPLQFAELLLFPVVWVLERLIRTVGRLFGVSGLAMVAGEEIRALISASSKAGEVEPEEALMLEKVFRFGDRQLREVMTPRTEIIALEKGATLRDFMSVYGQHSHTRFPVYEGSVDNILGTLSVKEVLHSLVKGEMDADDDVTHLLRDAYFVPETKNAADLFQELRQSGYQVVMVADEFGGVAGLVTLKQLVEEVVGRVGEEGSVEDEEFQAIDANTYQVDGGMRVDEANERMNVGIPDGGYETVAGFILSRLGHIPTKSEQIHYNGFLLEVVEMQGVKIEQVKITRVASPRLESTQ
jgi:putative hemolysin